MTEPGFDRGIVREELSAPHAECQAQQPENGNRDDAYFPRAQPDSHNQRQRNGHRNRKDAPGTLRQRLNHDQRKDSQQNNHDCQHADESEQTHAAPDFFLHHLSERLPTASDGGKENNHIVHAPAQRGPDQDPESAGQEPKLRREHGTNQRSRPGNRRKMVAEHHPPIGRDIIFVIILQHRRRSAPLI